MCGRVVQKTPLGEIRVLFETVNPAPTYNGAPTDTLPVVRLDRDGRGSLDLLRWGLVPYWAKDIKMGARCINEARRTQPILSQFEFRGHAGSSASFVVALSGRIVPFPPLRSLSDRSKVG